MVPVAMIDATGGATHFDFESLYADQFNPMVRLAGMITGSTAAAEDVVQDAFVALLLRSCEFITRSWTPSVAPW